MRYAIVLLLCSCASYTPVPFEMVRKEPYMKDLAQCREFASKQVSHSRSAVEGGSLGAIFGATLTSLSGGAMYPVLAGALYGGRSGFSESSAMHNNFVFRCMLDKGWRLAG